MPAFGLDNDDDLDDLDNARVAEVRRAHEPALLAIDGVQGITIESRGIGDPRIVVFVSDMAAADKVPRMLDGIQVEIEMAEFEALPEVANPEPTRARKPAKKKAAKPTAKKATVRAKKQTAKKKSR